MVSVLIFARTDPTDWVQCVLAIINGSKACLVKRWHQCHLLPHAFWYPQKLSWQDELFALHNMKSRTVGCNTHGRASREWSKGGKSPLFTCWPHCFWCSPGCLLGHKEIIEPFKIIISAQTAAHHSRFNQKPEIWLGKILSLIRKIHLASQRLSRGIKVVKILLRIV